jgi:hypothetical protein
LTADLVRLAEAAGSVGWTTGQLKRALRKVERQTGKTIIQGSGGRGNPYMTRMSDVRSIVPKLRPAPDRSVAELRAYFVKNDSRLEQLENRQSESEEGAYSAYEELHEKIIQLTARIEVLERENGARLSTPESAFPTMYESRVFLDAQNLKAATDNDQPEYPCNGQASIPQAHPGASRDTAEP